jgi:outer membrane protein OmpA-like peptidoglycan-associated protein
VKRSIVFCGLALAPLLLAGCALFGSDPVPPAPSLTGVHAEQNAWHNKIYSNPNSDTPEFEPLSDAQNAVNAAKSQPRVTEFDKQSLNKAKSALKDAQEHWQAIAEHANRDDKALAQVAEQAHRAERFAQIAQYTAARETNLAKLKQLQAQRQRRLARQRRQRLQKQRQLQRQRRNRLAFAGGQGGGLQAGGNLVGHRVVPEMLGSLNFKEGTARLAGDSRSVLAQLAKLVQDHPKLGVAIFGFTSNRAPSDDRLQAFINANPKLKKQDLSHDQQVQAYQQGLSLARARDVAELLVQSGVKPKRIGVRPMGASHPIASNDTNAGQKKNARVEAIMVPLKNNQGS